MLKIRTQKRIIVLKPTLKVLNTPVSIWEGWVRTSHTKRETNSRRIHISTVNQVRCQRCTEDSSEYIRIYTNPSVEIPKLSVDTSEAIVTLIQFLPEHFLCVVCADGYCMDIRIETPRKTLPVRRKSSYLDLLQPRQNVLEQELARC